MTRLFDPVVATNNTEKVVEKITGEYGEDVGQFISKVFKLVHVSFMSTTSFKISTANELKGCKKSYMVRARGKFDNRRYWGIDMNKASQLYLGTY